MVATDRERPVLFALDASRSFGEAVARHLDVPLSDHEERAFEDGEHKSRSLVNVRGRDVFVVQSLYSDERQSVNDKLVRLLFFLGALRDASAGRVTAVLPYLAYARKDKKTQTRDPVTTRYMALLVEAVGTDRVVTLDVHNLAAFQNAFRIRTDHLEANNLFVHYFAEALAGVQKVAVVSPDAGGIKRAERLRESLGRATGRDIPLGFMEKARARGQLTAGRVVGDVAGGVAIVIDDMISTGGTLLHAATACKVLGARQVYAAASHGVFVGNAGSVLGDAALDRVVVTDTVPPFRLDPAVARDKLVVLSTAALFADAILRIHAGGSLVDLLAG